MLKVIFAVFLFCIMFFTIYNVNFFDTKDSINNTNEINKKKYLTECELFNEIIDRSIKDSERQCYYNCGKNDNVRVDTSIEYKCQPFILEER